LKVDIFRNVWRDSFHIMVIFFLCARTNYARTGEWKLRLTRQVGYCFAEKFRLYGAYLHMIRYPLDVGNCHTMWILYARHCTVPHHWGQFRSVFIIKWWLWMKNKRDMLNWRYTQRYTQLP